MENSISGTPKAIRILGLVMGLFGVVVGVTLYVKPDAMITGLNVEPVATRMAANMVAGRALAQGILLFLAAWGAHPRMLRLAFVMRLITEGTDLYANLQASAPAAASAFVAFAMALEVFVIWRLGKVDCGDRKACA